MINLSCSAAAMAASAVAQVARCLFSDLERRQRIDAAGLLRVAMDSASSASDVSGACHWKAAYDACEAATVLFLRRHDPSMRAKAVSPASMLSLLAKIAAFLPTHTRRSAESDALQQLPTPIPLGEGPKLRRVGVMGAQGIELSACPDTIRDRLRCYGLFSQIISWKLRIFVPTDESGIGVLAKMLGRYPVKRVGEREVA
jgi:hypothetical protein